MDWVTLVCEVLFVHSVMVVIDNHVYIYIMFCDIFVPANPFKKQFS